MKDFKHCAFFKPAKRIVKRRELLKSEPQQTYSAPNPLDRYRVPVPRPTPRGY